MNIRALFGRREPADMRSTEIAHAVASERSAASRAGYVTLNQREREKIRAATIALAEKIGRPDVADPLR